MSWGSHYFTCSRSVVTFSDQTDIICKGFLGTKKAPGSCGFDNNTALVTSSTSPHVGNTSSMDCTWRDGVFRHLDKSELFIEIGFVSGGFNLVVSISYCFGFGSNLGLLCFCSSFQA